jgi:hypothetical protein
MADSCDFLRTNLAAQTPVYDERFLEDYKPFDATFAGRHNTRTWAMGSGDTHIYDQINVGYPNLQSDWQTISATECGTDSPCNPPADFVSFGSTRRQHNMKQKRLNSQLFCLTQLRYNTRPSEQITMIMKKLKQIPMMYTDDFLQVEAFKQAETVQIASADFATFTPDITAPGTNVNGQLTTIDLGAVGNLPTSQLTWNYLQYLGMQLNLQGYTEGGSGLPANMYNLMTDITAWFKLTNGNDSLKNMMALENWKNSSPLYKIGEGVQVPYGNFAPTMIKTPIRFQHMGNGILNRVQPYINEPGSTGTKPVYNPAWLNARYQLSWIWHPKAATLYTPDFKRVNDLVPTVNTAMYGKWTFINNAGVLPYEQPDGTACTINNPDQTWFYWRSAMELGFRYDQPDFVMPILHLIDGSGKDSTVNAPVCGDAPQYVAQDYSNAPIVCED